MSYQLIAATTVLTAPSDASQLNNSPIVIDVNSTAGAITLTLPALSTFTYSPGTTYIVKDFAGTSATNNITVAANAADEINNGASVVLSANEGALFITCTGLNEWSVTNSNGQLPVITRVATATGATTGTIANGNVFVQVSVTTDANDIIILPAPIPGTIVKLLNGATGYELRSSAPATVGINGGTGASAESAIAASTYVVMECISATNWIGSTFTSAGVKGVVEVAA